MADMFYFNAPWSPPQADHKGHKAPSRRHRTTGKRKIGTSRMDFFSERACMARFAEPLFCDNLLLPLFTRPEYLYVAFQGETYSDDEDDDESGGVPLDTQQDGQLVDGADQQPTSHELCPHDFQGSPFPFETASTAITEESDLVFSQSCLPTTAGSSGRITQTTMPSAVLGTRSRPAWEEMSQEEDSRRQRLALPGESPDGPLLINATPDDAFEIRRLSQQRSCESLRSVARYNHGPRPPILRTISDGTLATVTNVTGQSMPPVTQGQHEDQAAPEGDDFIAPTTSGLDTELHVAIGSDMVTWDVNDYRHTYDFADFVDEWEFGDQPTRMLSDPPFGLREVLTSRNSAALVPSSGLDKDKENIRVADVNKDVTPNFLVSGSDIQGIAWSDTQTTRDMAMRQRAYLHPRNNHRTWSTTEMRDLVRTDALQERLFRFYRFNARHRPTFTHYQLRNVVSSQERDIFYCSDSKVIQAPLILPNESTVAMDLTSSTVSAEPIKITCIATSPSRTYPEYISDSVLIAGGFYGEYALRKSTSHEPHTEGYVTYDFNGLVTHIHTFNDRRSGALQAAFCSNDSRLRIMDVATLKYTNTFEYEHSLNCAVTAPDGRLRAVVGDSTDALITDVQTGKAIVTLNGHTDHIFACAWSATERFVATAAQDGKVLLWDSRNWSQPLASLPSAMTCARSLHFTSDGAALVAPENEDVVRIHDMTDLTQNQDLRFFGTIAGVALSEQGDELIVANGDRTVGGLLSYQRAGPSTVLSSLPGVGNRDDRRACWRKRREVARRGAMVAELVV